MPSPSYHVITLKVPVNQCDFIQGELYDLGCLGLIEEDSLEEFVQMKAYFDDDCSLKARAQCIREISSAIAITDASSIAFNASQFKPTSFEPVQLAGDYWIVPPKDLLCDSSKNVNESQATSHESQMWMDSIHQMITIRPGMAFGTGRHETTQLCANAMLELDPRPDSLLDVGTGSGVLAILSRRIGIPHVCAIEISEDARQNAKENFELNEIADIDLYSDIRSVEEKFDVVVANILTPTIINLKTELISHLKPNGRLILSGIAHREDTKIEAAFSQMQCLSKWEREGWYCFSYENVF